MSVTDFTIVDIKSDVVVVARLDYNFSRLECSFDTILLFEVHDERHFARTHICRTYFTFEEIHIATALGVSLHAVSLKILLESICIVDAHHRIGQRSSDVHLRSFTLFYDKLFATIEIRTIETFLVDVTVVGLHLVGAYRITFVNRELTDSLPRLVVGAICFSQS